jgi:hypothetical protein
MGLIPSIKNRLIELAYYSKDEITITAGDDNANPIILARWKVTDNENTPYIYGHITEANLMGHMKRNSGVGVIWLTEMWSDDNGATWTNYDFGVSSNNASYTTKSNSYNGTYNAPSVTKQTDFAVAIWNSDSATTGNLRNCHVNFQYVPPYGVTFARVV